MYICNYLTFKTILMKQLKVLLILLPFISFSQEQQPDNNYMPVISKPLFESGQGPVLLIDAGHHNFHTPDERFSGFARVAAADGFRLQTLTGPVKKGSLDGVKVFVIANALNEKNIDQWQVPVYRAFTADEVEIIRKWVSDGGRLFLIADHMPFAGAAEALAAALGYTFYDGFAMSGPGRKYDVFSFDNGMLKHTDVTDMHGTIDTIITYTGQAFRIPEGATSILSFNSGYKILMPEVAWQFNKDMKMMPADGLSQLAYSTYGSGKVVVSGEAAMFTAQEVPGVVKFGLNAEMPNDNLQLLLNIMEWLCD